MEVLVAIDCFAASPWHGKALAAVSLPFNPVKLACLVGWVYLCLYFVQWVQFSPLVSRRYKSIANTVTLFLGPVLLFILLVIDVIRRYLESRSDSDVLGFIRQELAKAVDNIKAARFIGSRGKSSIILLDSSGRTLSEVYGKRGGRKLGHTLGLAENIIRDAIGRAASDVLIDPKSDSIYTVRFRIDGILRTVKEIESDLCSAVVNSIKAIAGMDISEKRRPQDGAFTAKTSEEVVSFRVASAGVLNGEKLSVRVLNQSVGMLSLSDVGLSKKQRVVLKNMVAKPSGMVLMCGPTGSGKTTTLYAMLSAIDFFTRNVITVEDPIEYVLPNASQIEINPKADITFAKALRSILRQDPDVICVGEIRDEETAAIALQASQTGHLVLATIHSSNNASALVRLLDLGITPLLLSSALTILVSQRLVRKVCRKCKRPAVLTQDQIEHFHKKQINTASIFQARGCKNCSGTGYRGRTGIFDILIMDRRLRETIIGGKLSTVELKKRGDRMGRTNLRKEGMKRVINGITTLEEVNRVTSDMSG